MILNITDNFFMEFTSEWKQLFGEWNWYTFTVIHVYFEKDDWLNGYEAEFSLLGFTIRFRYNTDDLTLESKLREWLDNEDEPLK